jgi:hypothetical protein
MPDAQGPIPRALLIAACVIPVVWPGDISFINDEPMLIINAVRANAAGRLAETGLVGTFGFTYGPFPTWVYQALTTLSHDLVIVAALHAMLVTAATAVGLWWLSRSLGLWPWFAAVPLLSPYFWFYARVLWDNPFLIPLGTLAVAGYAASLTTNSAWGFRVAVVAAIAMLLVHLMSLALVVPLGIHLLAIRRRALWSQRLSVAAMITVAGVTAWPYWQTLADRGDPATLGPRASGLLFPFSGARLLSARGLEYFFGRQPVEGWLLNSAAVVSSIADVMLWIGIGVAAWWIARAIRSRDWTPRTHLAAILLAALACQAVVSAVSGKFDHPQYHNGTWIAFTLLSWFAVDAATKQRSAIRWSGPVATALLAAALLVSVATVAVRLHRTRGTREVYGPTLGNQQQVARTLARYAPGSRVTARVDLYTRYPHTLAVLRELNPGSGTDRPRRSLEIRYASNDQASGAIEVVSR